MWRINIPSLLIGTDIWNLTITITHAVVEWPWNFSGLYNIMAHYENYPVLAECKTRSRQDYRSSGPLWQLHLVNMPLLTSVSACFTFSFRSPQVIQRYWVRRSLGSFLNQASLGVSLCVFNSAFFWFHNSVISSTMESPSFAVASVWFDVLDIVGLILELSEKH